MADPWTNDPIAAPAQAAQPNANAPWQSDPIVQPPKVPDTSGVQKYAQDNLAANDNKSPEEGSSATSQTPQQRWDTATGMPVQSVLNGTIKPSDINTANRSAYIDAIKNGSASNGSDWMQTVLHSVAPIVAGMVQHAEHPIDTAEEIGQGYTGAVKGGAGLLAYPFLSQSNKQELLENGTFPQLSDYKNPEAPSPTEIIRRAEELEQSTLGKAMGGLYAPVASILGPVVNPIIEQTGGTPTKPGAVPSWQSLIPGAIGAGMDVFGGLGIVHGAGELASLRAQRAAGPMPEAGTGPWDNHPGSEIIKEGVAKQLDKDPAAVTSSDIDQTIAKGSKDIHPPAKDFQSVNTVMGGDKLDTLHTIYTETGVRPEQVFEDARNNPEVASDVASDKIPEAYEHLIEPKQFTQEQGEKLQVARSDTAKAFNVVDTEGDHVQGGFDSAEEARQWIEDKKFDAEERAAIENEPITEKTVAGEQTVIPGAEKISDKELAERKMEEPLRESKVQKPANEGLFDVAGRGQKDLFSPKPKYTIPPSEIGKPTSLRTFLSNNGGKFNEANELISIKRDGVKVTSASALEHANDIAKEHGYLPKDNPNEPSKGNVELQNLLTDKNGGREAFRDADTNRVLAAQEAKTAKLNNDPSRIEHAAHEAGIDTDNVKGESQKKRTQRLLKELQEFYKNAEGAVAADAYRKLIGNSIIIAEKFIGKISGGLFEKLGESYIKTFAPELVGDKALRADAYMAKHKTDLQEAENSFYRQSAENKARWDKKTSEERMQWLYDHETGRWNEEDDPDHARYQALLDATFKSEKDSIGADADKGYKENYLPHSWENPEAVKAFFNSDAMIKKYGRDGFTKASTFQLIQDGVRAGFKLKTDNPESMLVARLLAGHDMMSTMNLLKDMESSGIAKPARAFSLDKRIAKTESSIAEIQEKYKKELDNISKQSSLADKEGKPIGEPISKRMLAVQERIVDLKNRLDDFNKEKKENKLTSEQMKELKTNGFKIIGPDNKVWNIHQQVAPLWKNAMESKGLWENQGAIGDAYRFYTAAKAIWTQAKLGLSLFHPVHVAMINLASGLAASADHLIQGGKLSDLALKDTGITMGITADTFKGQDHPAIKAWNAPEEVRTPEQKQIVSRMIEGGFKPTMSARDTVHFRENFDKAIKGVGLNNLRLIGTAISLPGLIMKPFFEHWIPAMKSEIYLRRYQDALDRDPSLENDAERRGEMARDIAKGTDRTYGEMNNDVQFWNKNVRDSFNAAFISGGWKLAQIYNARGLLQPLNIAYKFAKTGEFSKADITYNMLHAYTYTGLTLALGGAINAMLGNPIGKAKDTVWDMVKNCVFPQTGEKNPDGTPVRLNQPAFAKDAYMLAKDINTQGLISGTGSFLYHQTLIPSIVDTLNNRDFTGREIISNPTDLHQWMNAGWDSISPIAVSTYERAEAKHSEVGKIASFLGFPTAGSYINQTPFEQKVLYTYDEKNPPKGDVYSQKLKGELKSAIASGDHKTIDAVKQRMKEEGMTETQISNAEKPYTKKFVDEAWKKLSKQEQKQLIESASDEEKKKFKVRGE